MTPAPGRLILGVDPGLAACGWGVVRRGGSRAEHVAHGAVTTAPADGDDHARVALVAAALRTLLRAYRPDAVAMERWVLYGQSATTQAHTIGLVIGAALAVASAEGVPVVSAHRAQDWRGALGLPRDATKAAVQARVRLALGLAATPRPQHAADALAVAMVTGTTGGDGR